MGTLVLGVAGAGAGFLLGGPMGAAAGFSAGALLGTLIPTVKPPNISLGEIAKQTAKEAEPRVIVWGRVRPVGGNIIHCQAPVRRWVKQKSSGGKGGGGSKSQKVERVFRSYAIGVCEGPITGYSRIWRNGKLVYDARGNEWGAENNGVFLSSFKLYLGRWDQMPDPTLESIWGAGQVPAYRGTAYMVAINEDLTELGGSVPQWMFEVERAEGVYYTSRPYAVECEEESSGSIDAVRLRDPFHTAEYADNATGSITATEMVFRSLQFEYEYVDDSEGTIDVESLEFRTAQAQYDIGVEVVDGSISVQSLVFRVGLVVYQDPSEFEGLNGSINIQGLNHASV